MTETVARRASSPELVGRDAELAILARAIEEMASGRSRVVIVEGEAGIGKTRLVEAAADRARDSIRFARGNCLSLGASIPYLPFAEMVRGLIRELPQSSVSSIFGPANRELGRFMPELSAVRDRPQARPPRARAGDLERLRLYETLLRVTERIQQDGPALFLIEDVQWVDLASLELLSFLAHNTRRGRVLLVVTVRAEALDGRPRVREFLADLGRATTTEHIELGPLDLERTRHQIAGILGGRSDRATVERIWALGDGNPFFTEELVAAQGGSHDGAAVSPTLRDLLTARLTRLPAETLSVLRVAAAAGRSIDIDLLAIAAGIDRMSVEAAIRDALDEHIVVETSNGTAGYRFRHEIMRATVAAGLVSTEKTRIHARIAEALTSDPNAHGDPSEIAFHWDAAGERPRALPAHVEAGLRAEDGFAFEDAYQHFSRALELWQGVDAAEGVAGYPKAIVMQRAAGAAARAGRHERAIELARALLAGDVEIEPELRELVSSSLRWYLWEGGRPAEALHEAEIALDLMPGGPERWRANALGHMAGLLLFEDRTVEARRRAEQALEEARTVGATNEEVLAQGVLGWCLLLEGDVDSGIASIQGVVAAAGEIDLAGRDAATDELDDRRYPLGQVFAYSQLAAALELTGRLDEAIAMAHQGLATATSQGVQGTYGSMLRAVAARSLYRLGRWDETLASIDTGLSDGAVGSGRVALLVVRAQIAIARGHDQLATEAIADADDAVDVGTSQDAVRWLAACKAERHLWAGRPLDAIGALAAVADSPDTRGVLATPGQTIGVDPSLVRVLLLAARASADLALLERAGTMETAMASLAAERVQSGLRRIRNRQVLKSVWAPEIATTVAEQGRREHGAGPKTARRWSTAADANHDRPYEEAYARWRLAGALFGDRSRQAEAALELAVARTIAVRLGATRLVDAADELAGRAGLRPASDSEGYDRATGSGRDRPFGLTTRELEVLQLLAAGMGNNDIAERLFISPKTASVHVSNIYGKMGVESRVAAATMAHDLGLDTPTEASD